MNSINDEDRKNTLIRALYLRHTPYLGNIWETSTTITAAISDKQFQKLNYKEMVNNLISAKKNAIDEISRKIRIVKAVRSAKIQRDLEKI